MTTTKHTPTPWKYRTEGKPHNSHYAFEITMEKKNHVIAVIDRETPTNPEDEANAAFIVKAVNCHDDLVKSLEECLDELTTFLYDHAKANTPEAAQTEIESNPLVIQCRAILNKVKGE